MGSFTAVVAATSSKSGSSSYSYLLLIVLVFIGFYFLMIRPQRRRQQQAQQQQRTLSVGARVTTAGMYATVSAVDGDDVILEVAPGVDVRYMRKAVMEVVAPGEDEETETVEDDEPEDADGYADDDMPEDAEAHDESPDADPQNGNRAKSDKDNVF